MCIVLLKVAFAHLPQQRHLDDESSKEDMLALKVNKKLLQCHIMTETGRVVLLRDFHNIGATSLQGDRDKDLEAAINEFKKAEGNESPYICNVSGILRSNFSHIGAVVEVTVNSENVLSGIYFQDGHMREIYRKYPEIL